VDVKFSEGRFTQNGYLGICTSDGNGFEVSTLQDAMKSNQAIVLSMTQNKNAAEMVSLINNLISTQKDEYFSSLKTINTPVEGDKKTVDSPKSFSDSDLLSIIQNSNFNKIEAIKYLSNSTQKSLSECKDIIDSFYKNNEEIIEFAKEENSVTTSEQNDYSNILSELKEKYPNNKINAIKELSDSTGLKLNECKKLVDNYYSQNPGNSADLFKITKAFSGSQPVPRKSFSGFGCPKCGSTRIQLWNNTANMKEFQRTGLNLNPLHPLTPFKTKTVRKEKTSMAKLGLGLMTGGTSLLVTGTKNKNHNEYYCTDCGNRWIGK
jgi:ribosomal protein L7/L12/predicted RNA-binding Zn-ribbon protein involved in translation (DUF1610 family)